MVINPEITATHSLQLNGLKIIRVIQVSRSIDTNGK
jgi:hypothetical protein